MIIGGVAVVVIVTIAVVFFSTQGRTPKKSSAPATQLPAPGAPAPPGRLDAILLIPADVAAIMGLPNIDIKYQTQQLSPPSGSLSNLECLGAFEPIEESVYTGSASRAVRGQLLHTSDNDFRVQQAAVAFPNAEKARAFVTTSVEKWRACADKSVTMTTDRNRIFQWTFGNVTGAPPTITLMRTPEDASRSRITQKMAANVKS